MEEEKFFNSEIRYVIIFELRQLSAKLVKYDTISLNGRLCASLLVTHSYLSNFKVWNAAYNLRAIVSGIFTRATNSMPGTRPVTFKLKKETRAITKIFRPIFLG